MRRSVVRRIAVILSMLYVVGACFILFVPNLDTRLVNFLFFSLFCSVTALVLNGLRQHEEGAEGTEQEQVITVERYNLDLLVLQLPNGIREVVDHGERVTILVKGGPLEVTVGEYRCYRYPPGQEEELPSL